MDLQNDRITGQLDAIQLICVGKEEEAGRFLSVGMALLYGDLL